ncbi:ComEC/Rec2 family competence protein [Hoyosella subflava]|uniref:ComEC operon protein n=1 Tax=Hoyosella subflava (strain DSM 45089 / JCM 17490 / NBRC 109087 / DQS3-9A1) TaxID=443218 RepID=F6EQY5_HOYSD|nr:ComEC/Rec2 family competence protein [Hoyosella subflava]AEF39596.1 ComEC operon protein [Hoyosella subflava DQS3-9A1]
MTTSLSDAPPQPRHGRALDVRLLPAALLTWGSVLLAAYTGYRPVLTGALILSVVALTLAAMQIRAGNTVNRSVVRVLVAAMLFGAAACAAAGARAYSAEVNPLRSLAGEASTAQLEVVVRSDPRLVTPGPDGRPRFLIRASASAYQSTAKYDQWAQARGELTVFASGPAWHKLRPGETVVLRGQLSEPSRRDFTVATIFARGDPKVIAGSSLLQRSASDVRASFVGVVSSVLGEEQAQLLPGLVIGDRSAMSQQMRDDFIATSLTHLTVVSGTHVTIVCGAVLLVARYATGSRRLSAMVTGVALLWFVIVCRPEPSVLRAAAMGSVTLLALISGRRRQALPALHAAVIVLLLVRPQLATDLGFALSVTATAGIVVLTPPFTDVLVRRGVPKLLASVLAVSVTAHFVTAPLIAGFAGQFSVVGVLANLLAAPVVTVSIIGGYAGLLLAPLWTSGAEAVLTVTGLPVTWLLAVARYCAGLPHALITVPAGLSGAAAMMVVIVAGVLSARFHRSRGVVLAAAAGFVALYVPVKLLTSAGLYGPGFPPNDWVVAACDVGQGDGFALSLGSGATIIVDSGPDSEAIDRCLRRLRVREIDLVILTHMHADHVTGLIGVLRGRQVGAVAVGVARDPSTGFDVVRDAVASAGVALVELNEGLELPLGDAVLRVLGPPAARAQYLAPNDQSLVVSITSRTHPWPGFTTLFTGDAEEESQQWLLAEYEPSELRADVFTVPHHGAGTTIPRFITTVGPSVSLIGVGADNSYGHPHADVVATLQAAGSIIGRADDHGLVAVVAREGELIVVGERASVPVS